MEINIIKPFGDYSEGQVDLPDDVAQSLIDLGYAEAVGGEENKEDQPDQNSDGDEVKKAVDAIVAKIENRLVETATKSLEKINKVKRPEFSNSIPAEIRDDKHGFKSFGDYLRTAGKAALNDYSAMQRMARFKSPSGHSEGTSADGGYLVPQEWSNKIFEKMRDGVNLLDKTDVRQTSRLVLNVPIVNDTSRVDGSRPLRAYAVSEGNAYTGSKIAFGNVQLTLAKYGVLSYATDEVLQDNAYDLEGQIVKEMGDEFRFKLNSLIVSEVLNASALVTVSKETSQTTSNPVLLANLRKMYGRLYFASRQKACFFVNQAVMSELMGLAFPNASGSTPALGLTYSAADPFPMRVFGIPVVEVEACEALGTAGDIILADLSQIVSAIRPVEMAVSPHVNFTTGELAYRGFIRFDAAPLWTSALTPYKGSQTLSPFIVRETLST